MSKNLRISTVLLICIILVLGFFLYNRYLKEIILNNTSRSVTMNQLDKTHLIELEKLSGQSDIHSLELEITGISDRTICVLIGSEKDELTQQLLIKKGKIDFQYVGEWYTDHCYLFFPSDPGSDVELEVEYRFLGGVK